MRAMVLEDGYSIDHMIVPTSKARRDIPNNVIAHKQKY